MSQLLTYETSRDILVRGLRMKTANCWFGDPDHFPEPGVPYLWTQSTEPINSQDEDRRELLEDAYINPVPAPDTLEMMNMLRHCAFMLSGGGVRIFDNARGWHVCFDYQTVGLAPQSMVISEIDDLPVEAMARILIKLLGNKIINPERLQAYLLDKVALSEVIQP